MPQVQLPVFPNGCVEINRDLACRTEDGQVVYFNGHLPVFTHGKDDLASFRLFTAQLIVQGSATQGEIHRAFGVPLVSIKRSTKPHRARGASGFFRPKARREGTQLNAEKLAQAHALLVQGHPLAVVHEQTGVLVDTLRKAIRAQRLPAVKKKILAHGRQPKEPRRRPPRPRARSRRRLRSRLRSQARRRRPHASSRWRCLRRLYAMRHHRRRTWASVRWRTARRRWAMRRRDRWIACWPRAGC